MHSGDDGINLLSYGCVSSDYEERTKESSTAAYIMSVKVDSCVMRSRRKEKYVHTWLRRKNGCMEWCPPNDLKSITCDMISEFQSVWGGDWVMVSRSEKKLQSFPS